MTDEHEAEVAGIVKETGKYQNTDIERQMRSVAQKIEDHGEVHAVFDGVEGEVELRLGTTLVDYDTQTYEVWDGDNYQSFPATALRRARKPMDVIHG